MAGDEKVTFNVPRLQAYLFVVMTIFGVAASWISLKSSVESAHGKIERNVERLNKVEDNADRQNDILNRVNVRLGRIAERLGVRPRPGDPDFDPDDR